MYTVPPGEEKLTESQVMQIGGSIEGQKPEDRDLRHVRDNCIKKEDHAI
jgi:hypothetical protein